MTAPRTATAATLTSLLLASILNIEALTARMVLQPETPIQQLALSVMQPTQSLAAELGLTEPRRWLRALVGRSPARVPVPEVQAVELDGALARAVPADTGGLEPHGAEREPVAAARPEPSPPFPLQVWVIGDSLINMGGPRLATLLEGAIQAQVQVDSRPNTGLVRPDYFDWPATLEARLAQGPSPHLVVVLMGANDGQNMRVEGRRTERWSEAWCAEYARRVGNVMDMLRSSGARVAWLGLPGMRRRSHQKTADLLNGLIEAEADRRQQVSFIPLEDRFTYRGRRFSVHLERPDGQRFTARAGDGVHFTWTGSRVLADHVLAGMVRSWPDWLEPPEPAVAEAP